MKIPLQYSLQASLIHILNFGGPMATQLPKAQKLVYLNLSPNQHILNHKNPFCIDLVVTDQPNIILDSGTRASLDSYCHHQIVHCKVYFRIHPPLPFERKKWHFNRENAAAIKGA